MGFDTNKFTFSSKRCCNVNSNVLIINYSFTGYEKITNVFFKGEHSDLEKVSPTVNLLQKHVSSLMESNIALQEKCSELELSIDNNEL